LGVNDKVIFLGFRKDIDNLLLISDIIVLPSLWEGLSISLLEAMAAGKPIITTTIGSNLEVIKNCETGILIPPKSPDEISKSINLLLNNPELRKKIGQNARQVFCEKYTEERMLNEYMEEYQLLCKNKGVL